MDEGYRAELTKIADSMARHGTNPKDAAAPAYLPLFRAYYRHLAELTRLVQIEPEGLDRKDPAPVK
jgi:hypothetical protein